MRVTRLEFSGLRCFEQGALAPGPGLNLLIGPNGSGKSSVLEALHLMAYGRSFRGRVRDGLRSEEHTSELQSLMRISYAVFCLKKKIITIHKSTLEQLIKREIPNIHSRKTSQ